MIFSGFSHFKHLKYCVPKAAIPREGQDRICKRNQLIEGNCPMKMSLDGKSNI